MNMEERIQELRKGKGLSQEQLADVLGVSRQAVSKWEGGQSLPEVEKLISMSELFGVTVDYILKGEMTPLQQEQRDKRRSAAVGAQIVSAVAAMILAVGLISTVGRLSDGVNTMDTYSGLVIECVGIMLMLAGFFIAGGRILSKPLFVVSVLIAGVLPASFISQTLLRCYPRPLPPFAPLPILLFAAAYVVLCGVVIYFTVIRKK